MQYVGKVFSTVSQLYKELNPATLSGAIDVVVVEGEDGELSCSPFHVRFGKLQLLRPSDKAVQVIVNGRPAEFYMKVGDSGEGFFVLETDADVPSQFATSPVASPALSFRADDDPDFLDLGADVRVQDLSRDGYVSAPSAHESDADESLAGDDDGPRRRTRSSSLSLAKPDDLRRQSFSDDMAIDLRQGIEALAARAAHIGSDDGSTSGMADSAATAAAQPAGDDSEIHTDWDWGVGIEPTKDTSVAASVTGQDTAAAREIDSPPHDSGSVDITGILQAHPDCALELSLCGFDRLRDAGSADDQRHVFDGARVSADSYARDAAAIVASPDLVFRLGDSTYVQREELVVSLVSQLAFGRPLGHATATTAVPPALAAASMAGTAGGATREGAAAADGPGSRRWWHWSQRVAATQPLPPPGVSEASAPAESQAIDIPAAATRSTGDLLLEASFSADEGAGLAGDGEQHVHYAKTLRLTSAQLKSLNLQRGANTVRFLVPSNKAYCEARIFMYRHDAQIVISDIDGTITKSDALGHLFNMVGKDWTHHGVAKLFTDIASNGYEILYLTSRAIGQADGTRYFLDSVRQGQYRLPNGPLLLSPDRLFTSFHREVIMRRPQEFKMACLRDIRKLFADRSPFYAGFGNRITDAMSYRSVNVPVSRICTIDTSGEIKLDLLPGYTSSYVGMGDLVDMMFPPLASKLDPKFNDWEYWRATVPSVDDELALLDAELKPLVAGASPALPQTRDLRTASTAVVPSRPSPPRGSARDAAMSTPELAVRQRADSWTPTTPTTPTTPSRPAPAAGAASGRMSILKKASAFSPFGFVRGSSPPKFEYENTAVSVSTVPAADGVTFSPLLSDSSATRAASVAAVSFEFSHMRVMSAGALPLQATGSSPDLHALDGDDDNGPVASDPAVAAAATRLVPQPPPVQRVESSMSFQSRYSAYEADDGSDGSNDGDDDDDDIDQDTLDIMQDMEQLQRLQ